MGKPYKNVLSLLKDISDDSAFNKVVENQINRKRLSKILFSMRCKAHLTQDEMAAKINVSQSQISKIEHADDIELTIHDLANYCSACNMKLDINFMDKNMKAVDEIKYHHFRVKQILENLVKWAKADNTIKKGVNKFMIESFFNFAMAHVSASENLKQPPLSDNPINVSEPFSMADLQPKEQNEMVSI